MEERPLGSGRKLFFDPTNTIEIISHEISVRRLIYMDWDVTAAEETPRIPVKGR